MIKEVILWQLSNVQHLDVRLPKRVDAFLRVVLNVGHGGVASTEQKATHVQVAGTSI